MRGLEGVREVQATHMEKPKISHFKIVKKLKNLFDLNVKCIAMCVPPGWRSRRPKTETTQPAITLTVCGKFGGNDNCCYHCCADE